MPLNDCHRGKACFILRQALSAKFMLLQRTDCKNFLVFIYTLSIMLIAAHYNKRRRPAALRLSKNSKQIAKLTLLRQNLTLLAVESNF